LFACGAPTSDVADLSVVTVLPKEVGAGGYRSTLAVDGIATGFFYKAAISDCGAMVVETAREWAAGHLFVAGEGQVLERRADVRLESDDPPGSALMVRYSLSSDHGLGRIRISYEAGAEGEIPSPQELEALGVKELIEAQLAAATCEAGA
jgi:hypothetical protein